MSDIGPMPDNVAQPHVNQQLVNILRAALKDAEEGRLLAGGILFVPALSSFNAICAPSTYFAEMLAATVACQDDVMARMRQFQQSQQGRILRAANMPTRQ